MRRLKPGIVVLAVALLLIVPHAASAGMGDFIDTIIGLTGPQMVGIPMACEVTLTPGVERETACYIAGIRVPWPALGQDDGFWARRNYWVSFGGGVYTSTGKDSEMGGGFDSYDVWMLALEPTLNIRSISRRSRSPKQGQQQEQDSIPKFTMEHGVGPSLMFFFGNGIDGKDFEAFANGGIKVKPVAVTFRNIAKGLDLGIAYNLRIFPKPFTAEDFGGDPAANEHEGREYAHGFSVSLSF